MVVAIVVVQLVIIVALGVLVVGLLRSHADVQRRLHELGAGLEGRPGGAGGPGFTPAPGIAAPAASSRSGTMPDLVGTSPELGSVAVAVADAGRPTLLAFLSSGCTTCAEFWDTFADPRFDPPGDDTRLVVVTRGVEHESPPAIADLAPEHLTTVMSTAAWNDYQVPASPYFVLLDPAGGVAGEGSAASWAHVRALVERAAADGFSTS